MYSGFETNTWKQSNNPFYYATTKGYQAVDVRGKFAGLNRGNLWAYAPFALYVGQPWRDAVKPTKGKIQDVSGNGYHAEMRSNNNEDLYLVKVGAFPKGGKTTVAAPPGKTLHATHSHTLTHTHTHTHTHR